MTGLNSLPGIWRLARIKMKIALIVIGCFLVGMGIGVALGGSPVDCGAPDNLDYLIDSMEVARESHQDIVDNPERYGNWIKGGVDHRIWVETYEEIIEVLKNMQ